jgi:hypothetical protein
MKQNIFKVGAIVGAIAMFSSSVNAQSIVDNRLLIAQSERNSSQPSSNNNAQECKEEASAPGSGGKPTKICRNPKYKNIQIDWCGPVRGICNNTESSAQAFCKLQGDEYTELLSHGVTPKPISQTISITDGKTCQGRCYPFVWIRCVNPNSIADNKPKKDRSAVNQPDRSNKKKNKAPLFKGALDLAANRQFTISVPVGNGQRQDVVIRVNESGQLIDPLTNQVAVPAKQSTGRNTLGTQTLNNMLSKIKIKINKLKNSTEFERLNYSVYAFEKAGDTLDAVEIIIESRLRKVPNINVSSMIAQSIASGFITGDFPDSLGLKDLDGLGVLPIFNKVNTVFKNAVDGVVK